MFRGSSAHKNKSRSILFLLFSLHVDSVPFPILQVMLEDTKTESGGGSGKEKPKTCKMREFFIKWEGKSYWKCSWVSELRVSGRGLHYIKMYMYTRIDDRPTELCYVIQTVASSDTH